MEKTFSGFCINRMKSLKKYFNIRSILYSSEGDKYLELKKIIPKILENRNLDSSMPR